MRDLIISFAIGMWSLWTEVLHEIRSNWRRGKYKRGLVGESMEGWQMARPDRATECGGWVIGEAYHTIGWDPGRIIGGQHNSYQTGSRRGHNHIHPDSGQCVINIGQVSSKYWSMWKGKHVVLSRIDAHRRGLNGGICSKKVALPNSWVFSQLSPGGGGYFSPRLSPGWQLLSNSIPPLWSAPSPTQINRGKRQKV